MPDQVAQDANRWLGEHADSALLIDESGCPKKGTQSVGVARQWCGQLGKVENGQVGVFAALSRGADVTLIDERLFLPEAWTNDPARCQAAGIPQAQRGFQRKTDLALAMIVHARQQGIGFAWVGFDGFYGSDPAFLRACWVYPGFARSDEATGSLGGWLAEGLAPFAPWRRQKQRRFPLRPVAAPSQRRPHGPLQLGVDGQAVARATIDHAIQYPIAGILEEVPRRPVGGKKRPEIDPLEGRTSRQTVRLLRKRTILTRRSLSCRSGSGAEN